MKKLFLITSLYLFVGCHNKNPLSVKLEDDDFYEKCRKLVLSENQTNQEFYFSRKIKGVDEISITYLGEIVTTKKDTLKILNSINYSGQFEDSKHGNGSVFIYDVHNTRIGLYYVGAAWAVASRVEKGSLVFNYVNELCNQSTSISLKDSIPKQIFIRCTERGGDFYNFTNQLQ